MGINVFYKLPNPRVEYINGERKVRLLENLVTPEESIPSGFVSDGLSGNWLVHLLFPQFDDTLAAVIVHDWCYGGYVKRNKADKLLLRNLKRLGTGWLKRHLIYLGVRIGGSSHYTRRRGEGNASRVKR